jgi:S-formylglutathione hydrolase FrmB
MSKEMLPRKLSEGLAPESLPSIIETNKEKRQGLILVCLMAVGVVIVPVASIVLLPYVNSLEGNIFGGVSSTTDSANDAFEATAALGASFKAIDAKGDVIENNDGVARSEEIILTGYSDSVYNTKMLCTIDMLSLYCDGGPIAISGLPYGKHTFTIMEPSSGETIVRVFSWRNISS